MTGDDLSPPHDEDALSPAAVAEIRAALRECGERVKAALIADGAQPINVGVSVAGVAPSRAVPGDGFFLQYAALSGCAECFADNDGPALWAGRIAALCGGAAAGDSDDGRGGAPVGRGLH